MLHKPHTILRQIRFYDFLPSRRIYIYIYICQPSFKHMFNMSLQNLLATFFSHTCCSPQTSCPAAHMLLAYDGIREATAAATLQAPVPDPRWLQEFQAQLHIRGARPHPKILTSLRTSCPHCHAGLTLRTQRQSSRQVNNCRILSDNGSIQVYHAPKFCSTCKWPRFWCGYMQTKEADTKRTKARVKTKQQVDIAFLHPDVWMCHRFFGITTTWLRRWRYRMYLQRASFQSEALLPTLADGVLS